MPDDVVDLGTLYRPVGPKLKMLAKSLLGIDVSKIMKMVPVIHSLGPGCEIL